MKGAFAMFRVFRYILQCLRDAMGKQTVEHKHYVPLAVITRRRTLEAERAALEAMREAANRDFNTEMLSYASKRLREIDEQEEVLLEDEYEVMTDRS